ncbi:hypothetical protein EV193_10138 [Herbihabitans rhizosphaerae]|uniref:VOC domain-containing protein n=1 Tax=Herbihabitans rhizosphaerae TaxID=1872711 RepID=A0A4V2EUD2_9PSEU|nr:VOC family protein [Herbihabitans rhizosphaerae]RZS44163.1 hypothetical protein EV193_10138 [Herbihabitans rhizosphaerae]
MSYVTENQPNGTPTWIDLGVPDIDRALEFYGALFGWEFEKGPAEYGSYTMCRHNGKRAAAISQNAEPGEGTWWNMYVAADDCDATAKRVVDAGGTLVIEPMDIMDQGRMAIAKDPTGAQFGLWQGRAHLGCEIVNEPNALVRNDLVTPNPGPAREFYATVFDYTLDANPDMPEFDFTFLRLPAGNEIGGIMGNPEAPSSRWETLFEVADTDETVARARAAGGTATDPEDTVYVRQSQITDPFGTPFTVGTRTTEW